MDQRNLISSLIFFLLACILLIASLGLGTGSWSNPQAGFMPCLMSVLILVSSLALFFGACQNRSVLVRFSSLWHHIRWQKSLAAVFFLCVYIVVLPLAGYLIATAVLMMALLSLNSLKLWTSALAAVLSVAASYGLFYFILKTPLPRGIWGF
jgi:putative tricarboxylic transport membrane protein